MTAGVLECPAPVNRWPVYALLSANAISTIGNMLTAIGLAGLPLWPIALVDRFQVILAALFVMGASIGPISPLVMTIMHERVPAELRGRVFGALTAIASASIPLGILIIGIMIELLGLQPTNITMGVAYLAIALTTLINPAFKQIEKVSAVA